jgi:hypothetical protein
MNKNYEIGTKVVSKRDYFFNAPRRHYGVIVDKDISTRLDIYNIMVLRGKDKGKIIRRLEEELRRPIFGL